MKLIKQAITYAAEIPGADVLRKHLAERPFYEIGLTEQLRAGFVPRSKDRDDLVVELSGGLAFTVRIDQKAVPSALIKRETDKLANHVLDSTGRHPGKKERKELAEVARLNLIVHAFPKTAVLTCFYHAERQHLIIPTTSKLLARICVAELIHAVGSVKTTTINVSNVKGGLTTRLRNWLGTVDAEGEENEDGDGLAFGEFLPVSDVAMSHDVQKLTLSMNDLNTARKGLREALAAGFDVTSLGLAGEDVSFRISADFTLRDIKVDSVEPEDGDVEELWVFAANHHLQAVSGAVAGLCEMFGYKPPTEEDTKAEPETAPA